MAEMMAKPRKKPDVWLKRSAVMALAFAGGIAAYHFSAGGAENKPVAGSGSQGPQAADKRSAAGFMPKPVNRNPVGIASTGSPEFIGKAASLVDESGELSAGAAEAAGLSEDERERAQEAIDYLWKSARESVASRVVEDVEAMDADNGVRVYKIPAAEDRGKGLLEDLKIKLSGAVGEKKAATLYHSLNTTGPFGGFGRFDVSVEFHYPEAGSDGLPTSGEPKVRYSYIGPSSRGLDSSGEISVEKFQEKFGGAIVVPEPPEKKMEVEAAEPVEEQVEGETDPVDTVQEEN